MKTFKQYLSEEVNEKWFENGSFETSKKADPIKYETAKESGTVKTLEGPVKYEAGHKIVTGPKGEKYPIHPDKFKSLYDDHGDGTATPKKIVKQAKVADHDGVVHASWGDLNYKKGEDVIVRHGEGDYGVVKKDIFHKTYDDSNLKEHIVKVGSQYRLVSKKSGKNLGTYPTKAGAEKRERQVQYFKHHG